MRRWLSLRWIAPLGLWALVGARTSDLGGPVGAFMAGRDFWPADLAQVDFIAPPTVGSEGTFSSESFFYDGQVYVLVFRNDQLYLGTYDLDSGALDFDTDGPPALAHAEADDAPDRTITNVVVAACRSRTRTDAPLTWSAETGSCLLPDLGVDPASLLLTRSASGGCGCGGEVVPDYVVEPGSDARGRVTDGVRMAETPDACDAWTASYTYTDCSLPGTDRWRCPVSEDEGAAKGACASFMMWESEGAIDGNPQTPPDRMVSLAHAARPTGPWVKWMEDGRTVMTEDDVRVKATGPHMPGDQWTGLTFASVPDLWYDEKDQVWRMWITVEAGEGSAGFYTESADDGLSWGITRRERSIDCWSDELDAYDPELCTRVRWKDGAVPPDDPNTSRNPDAVDFAVMDHPRGAPGEVAILFTAANAGCPNGPHAGAFLFGSHPDGGDLSDGSAYTWHHQSLTDPDNGLVIAANRSGDCTIVLHDFNVTQVDTDKYVMFFTQVPANGVHVAGSGFACSNFVDDDGDGTVDYGHDDNCQSPTDDTE